MFRVQAAFAAGAASAMAEAISELHKNRKRFVIIPT
jgi:hypothetical protein